VGEEKLGGRREKGPGKQRPKGSSEGQQPLARRKDLAGEEEG